MNPEQLRALGIPHSCYPNTIVTIDNELITVRKPTPGEPLTVDYSTVFTPDTPPFECQCGMFGCRGIIRGIDSVPFRIREWYEEWGGARIMH